MSHLFYDEKNDILAVHKGFSAHTSFQGNVDIGPLILDLSTDGNVRGFEILDASLFLERFGITYEMLTHLTTVDFSPSMQAESIFLALVFHVQKPERSIPVTIAVPTPLAPQ